ncbi:hypothetical protein [Methyloglobulus morosus]|uniref:hypothetical protein n=1 Tax=Methyloglobulus morosus TaxID=1410681 RepID=UPI000560A810|nr:hypothetical protein [Methyloglobulus morosus]
MKARQNQFCLLTAALYTSIPVKAWKAHIWEIFWRATGKTQYLDIWQIVEDKTNLPYPVLNIILEQYGTKNFS